MKRNLDLTLAYVLALVGAVLLFEVSRACSGAGCLFGAMLAALSLLGGLVMSIVALRRRSGADNRWTRWSSVPALLMTIVGGIVLASNIGPM